MTRRPISLEVDSHIRADDISTATAVIESRILVDGQFTGVLSRERVDNELMFQFPAQAQHRNEQAAIAEFVKRLSEALRGE